MELYFPRTKETIKTYFSGKLADLFTKYDINPECVVAVRDGIVITLDTVIADKDILILLPVISGG